MANCKTHIKDVRASFLRIVKLMLYADGGLVTIDKYSATSPNEVIKANVWNVVICLVYKGPFIKQLNITKLLPYSVLKL